MSIKGLIGTVLDTAVKIFLIIVVVTYTYKYAILAYDFGYRIFAEKAVSTEETAKYKHFGIGRSFRYGNRNGFGGKGNHS